MVAFGYIPDMKGKNALVDFFLKLFGYPYLPRRMEAKKVIWFASLEENDRILDVGCGDGVWTNYLKLKGFNVFGLDNSKDALNVFKKRAHILRIENMPILGDSRTHPFKENVFDKIISICVFEHIKNDQSAFNDCYRVLKKGGRFVLSVDGDDVSFFTELALKLPDFIKKRIGSDLLKKSKNKTEFRKNFDKKFMHSQTYNKNTLFKKARVAGFKVKKVLPWVGTFSQFASVFHCFKIFELKGSHSLKKYPLSTAIAYMLINPLLWLFYFFDRFLPKARKLSYIAVLEK